MRIQFRRRAQGECVSVIHRPDGVVLELPSYSRKYRVPHDIAHAATERELGIAGGVYGLIASGVVFPNMTVVAGKPKHDATTRSERVMKAYGGSITTAEVLAGVVHDAVEHHRADLNAVWRKASHDWGIVEQEPFPYSQAEVDRAVAVLRDLDERWVGVPVEGELEFEWPRALIQPVPRG